MKKVGMVLEGGSMRGMFTAGVLDVLMENKINVDGIVGVSAGALIGVNYFSNQQGRVIRYNKKYCNDKRYISLNSFITTGNLVNKEFTYYKVTKELDPFDNETFIKSKKDYYVTVTNIENGASEYLKINNVYDQLEEFRATSAIPLASEIIEINGKKYLDGGISDSIPLDKCISLGYEKIIVILTQPKGFIKPPLQKQREKLTKLKYKNYQELIDTMVNRHIKYNKVLEKITNMENKKEIFVIRPSEKINIKITENNPEKLQEIYDLGVNNCKEIINKLKEYLNT